MSVRGTAKLGVVAVGTAITDRPRTDPYERSYRIRLLPKVVTRGNAPLDKDVEPGMAERTYG